MIPRSHNMSRTCIKTSRALEKPYSSYLIAVPLYISSVAVSLPKGSWGRNRTASVCHRRSLLRNFSCISLTLTYIESPNGSISIKEPKNISYRKAYQVVWRNQALRKTGRQVELRQWGPKSRATDCLQKWGVLTDWYLYLTCIQWSRRWTR